MLFSKSKENYRSIIEQLKEYITRVAWGILGRGVFWVSGLSTFLKPFFNDVLKVLETSHVKQMCSLLPKVSALY